ncbi:MAG: hydroxymethylglutaryl-CoA reductase, degradative, partial [Polyangiaceae bacterium]|nr:hydroxymethylglutaryl-CoA reductase, degradative [Polyangiaceae bacterium]
MTKSELPGFYKLSIDERRARLAELTGLDPQELARLSGAKGLADEQADRMVENALGVIGMPLGLCANLRVNGRDRLVPMAVEEPSVVAACSHAAKLLRAGGGVEATVSAPHMVGQIQLLDVADPAAAEAALLAAKGELLAAANAGHPSLCAAGGGALELLVRRLPSLGEGDPCGDMLIVHLVVDVRDAMGANAINSMCEHLAPRVAELARGRVGLRILSNLCDRRTVSVRGRVPLAALAGKGGHAPESLARGIEEASVFAERDPYRAATHNKGIMNGVDAVLVAFGQDWRAVESGAHAFAARGGRYTALARWRVRGDALVGELVLPLAVGTVGGVAGVHPVVAIARHVAGVEHASDLAALVGAVGLAQNLGALRALAAEGIQHGHMRLHARNVAVEAGALGEEVDRVAARIADARTVNVPAARAALAEVRAENARAGEAAAKYVSRRFHELADRYLPRVMALIEETARSTSPEGSSLTGMLSYHLETGGKRLRALLPMLVAETLGGDADAVVPLGAACEMLHNATLVHDDLQDGDATRRGRDTVWRRFGNAQAINLGDAMFYYTLLLGQRLTVTAERRELCARRVLLDTLRVIDGQEREFILKSALEPTLADYFTMVEGKTSGLFALPIAGAAEVCGAPPALVDALAEAARHLGVIFQIQDDVLDLYGDKGREVVGSDIGEGKRSALVVHALTHGSPAEVAWLRGVLDKPREETSADDVVAAKALFERLGSLDFALAEIADRRIRALAVAGLAEHERLRTLVAGVCDLFLDPIRAFMSERDRRG